MSATEMAATKMKNERRQDRTPPGNDSEGVCDLSLLGVECYMAAVTAALFTFNRNLQVSYPCPCRGSFRFCINVENGHEGLMVFLLPGKTDFWRRRDQVCLACKRRLHVVFESVVGRAEFSELHVIRERLRGNSFSSG
jgi:hypothetical protein